MKERNILVETEAMTPQPTGSSNRQQEQEETAMEGCCFSYLSHSTELRILFLTDQGDPISFCTKDLPCREQMYQANTPTSLERVDQAITYREHVNNAITNNGGMVSDTPGHYTVCLVPTPKSGCTTTGMEPGYSTFSVDYIWACIREKRLQPLQDYWIHKVLDFNDKKFDPIDVMLGNLKWEDCKKRVTVSSPRRVHEMDPNDELFFDFDSVSTKQRHPKCRFVPRTVQCSGGHLQ
ncbi:uncharacterized protein LOC123506575 isoform X2 [Portunus trituberculatus]|uniref:uncharacterized protein LOC123506575 isoform X2 n=1 Tax=Portunus trituberculatus TaxID=210409 RepID=UPI001E1CD921|nr:uncharacterized protein LOC123506575 isoform X2 [Portunus trituberculatus]